jgi:hypothetical protein
MMLLFSERVAEGSLAVLYADCVAESRQRSVASVDMLDICSLR